MVFFTFDSFFERKPESFSLSVLTEILKTTHGIVTYLLWRKVHILNFLANTKC